MKKIKNETELVKEAIRVGMVYAEKRGVAEFEATDSREVKIEYLYRLLVHDKLIQPLPNEQISMQAMRHKLAHWILKTLPAGHPLVKQATSGH